MPTAITFLLHDGGGFSQHNKMRQSFEIWKKLWIIRRIHYCRKTNLFINSKIMNETELKKKKSNNCITHIHTHKYAHILLVGY